MTTAGRAPSWLYGITAIPYGVGGAFIATLMPYQRVPSETGRGSGCRLSERNSQDML